MKLWNNFEDLRKSYRVSSRRNCGDVLWIDRPHVPYASQVSISINYRVIIVFFVRWKQSFAYAFSQFPHIQFFIRYEKDDLMGILPDNVHISKWLPQKDLLREW